jgi:hypothetical protein
MGQIVTQNTSDQCALPAFREVFYCTPPWNTWHELRMGMLFSIIPVSGTDGAAVVESMTVSNYMDWLLMGLKDNGLTAPGTAGSSFVGLMATGTLAVGSNSAGASNLTATSWNAYSTYNGSAITTTAGQNAWAYPTYSASSYCAFYGLRFVVGNDGLSTQTVTISSYAAAGPIATITLPTLRISYLLTNTANFGAANAVNWYTGGAALALPCMAWLRFPFFKNRLRLTAFDMVKLD